MTTVTNSPCIVVPWIYSDSTSVTTQRLVQLFCCYVLMAQQSVGICKVWINLRGNKNGNLKEITEKLTEEK